LAVFSCHSQSDAPLTLKLMSSAFKSAIPIIIGSVNDGLLNQKIRVCGRYIPMLNLRRAIEARY
jgi:hypothetical protein